MMMIWLYSHLLRLYPTPFYERFASEMLDVFTQAWSAVDQKRLRKMGFYIREFVGLLISISNERWNQRTNVMPRQLFRWYLIPYWLFGFSVLVAATISLLTWGYIVKPTSLFQRIASVESIALVTFDEDHYPTAIPLNDVPYLISPYFPPSQILSQVHVSTEVTKQLDPNFANQLADALATGHTDLGRIEYIKYPMTMNVFDDECQRCKYGGVQPRADGGLVIRYPVYSGGKPTGEYVTDQATIKDLHYYNFLLPAAYLITGRAIDGTTPLVFVGLASGPIGDSRDYQPHHYYEYVFEASNNTLTLLDQQSQRFYPNGRQEQDYTVFRTVLNVFIPLFVVFLIVLSLKTLVSGVRSLTAKRPLLEHASRSS